MYNPFLIAELPRSADAGAGAGAGADRAAGASKSRAGLSLRRKINLVFAALTLLVLGIIVTVEIQGSRNSIREEMEASHRISTQLLSRVGNTFTTMNEFAVFLKQTGRVRASEVTLTDEHGTVLYVSPPPTYKAGRFAPDWYAALVAPRIRPTVIYLGTARLRIEINPSRAVLDSWDDLNTILISQGLAFLAADFLMFWLVGRWLAPFEQILQGLRQIEAGQHQVRLPALPGREAGQIGCAFNRMARAVQENIQVRRESADAHASLIAQRESTQILNARIEDERAALARELHDELGQSLTAIRSIAKSLLHSPGIQGGEAAHAAQLLFDTAGATSDAVHRMIPRLRPMQLEGMGLADAVRDMVSGFQLQHPGLRIVLHLPAPLPELADLVEISAYRIVQEALTNVVRHARAARVDMTLLLANDALEVVMVDDGIGMPAAAAPAGHYGLRGMQERAESLGGSVHFSSPPQGGLQVHVRLPLPRCPLAEASP